MTFQGALCVYRYRWLPAAPADTLHPFQLAPLHMHGRRECDPQAPMNPRQLSTVASQTATREVSRVHMSSHDRCACDKAFRHKEEATGRMLAASGRTFDTTSRPCPHSVDISAQATKKALMLKLIEKAKSWTDSIDWDCRTSARFTRSTSH